MRTTHRIPDEAAIRTLDSPVGPLVLAATERGLTHVLFPDGGAAIPPREGRPRAEVILDDAVRQLAEYFAGDRRSFDLPLAPRGSGFQLDVWRQLVRIPFGETVSYGEIAARLGKPRAVRAIGAANGANPLSIVVPCHRVIGASGKLTGYAGGLEAKQHLLDLEARATAVAT